MTSFVTVECVESVNCNNGAGYCDFQTFSLFLYERASFARATRVVIHFIFVLGFSALSMGEGYF